jgi:RHS repeat-associated protein
MDSLLDGLTEYNHDDTNQLTGADHTGQTDESYTYDDNGNRIMSGYVVGANNRITSDGTHDYEYDAEGNLTAKETIATGEREEYAWDHRNRLMSVTCKDGSANVVKKVEQTYDLFNRWVRSQVDADGDLDFDSQRFFAYDGNQIIVEFDGNDLVNRYVWSYQVDQLLAVEQVTSLASAGTVIYALTDHLDTTRDLATYNAGTDTTAVANHRRFDSFGNLVSETNGSVTILIGFTGRPFDEAIDKQWNLNRWYISTLGVWMSEDPIGFAGGTDNLREYVDNDPISYVDPTGLSKGGKKNIRVSGVPANVTKEQLEALIEEAIKNGKSQEHIRALQGQLKVLKRKVKFRGGCADVRLIAAKVGVILMVAEVTSIVNHGFDELDLRLVSQETNPDHSVTATYFVKKYERSGALGAGPLTQVGTLLYVLTIPAERIERDGPPKEHMRFTVYNIDTFSELLAKMGIKEEWVELPSEITCYDELFAGIDDDELVPPPSRPGGIGGRPIDPIFHP